MHSKSDSVEIMICDKGEEVIKELLKSLLNRYQIKLKISMKGSGFIFDCVHLLQWIKIKKATVNPIDDDKFFQYVATEIGRKMKN